jgi:hypothetical protein
LLRMMSAEWDAHALRLIVRPDYFKDRNSMSG